MHLKKNCTAAFFAGLLTLSLGVPAFAADPAEAAPTAELTVAANADSSKRVKRMDESKAQTIKQAVSEEAVRAASEGIASKRVKRFGETGGEKAVSAPASESGISIYEAVGDGRIEDVTDLFTATIDEDGKPVLTARVRGLGVYIVTTATPMDLME